MDREQRADARLGCRGGATLVTVPHDVHSSGVIKLFCAVLALGWLSACGQDPFGSQSRDCTLDLRSAPRGMTRDKAGNPVSPTRVVRRDHGNEYECSVHPDGYSCTERSGGRVEIEVYVGDRSWTKRVDVAHDGCHERDTQLDFVLDGLPSCQPATAVEGSLPAEFGAAEVWLARVATRPEQWNRHVPCVVEQNQYRCPALGLYDTGEFELRLDGAVEATLRIEASACRVETQQYDFE